MYDIFSGISLFVFLINQIINELELLEDDENGFRKSEIIENWKKQKDKLKTALEIQVFEMEAELYF